MALSWVQKDKFSYDLNGIFTFPTSQTLFSASFHLTEISLGLGIDGSRILYYLKLGIKGYKSSKQEQLDLR